jgi:peptidoglycan/LPS O-acetylase OafA/YrhL
MTAPPREEAPPAPAGAPRFYRPELDGLRFFAFLAVFWSHVAPVTAAKWGRFLGPLGGAAALTARAGSWGVDLFFVLSSYLITSLLLKEKEQRGQVAVFAFWARRALRIWPLYFVFCAAVFLIGNHVLDERIEGRAALTLATFTANWGLVVWGGGMGCAAPLWSVSMEEQFYLVWPLVARGLAPRRIAGLCAAMIPFAIAVRCVLVPRAHDARALLVWADTFARLDPIAAGALLAIVFHGRSPRIGKASARVLVAAGALAVMAAQRGVEIAGAPAAVGALSYTLAAAGCTAVLAGVLALGAGGVLGRPAVVYLGRISYGLYVFHLLVCQAVDQIRGEAPATAAAHGVAAAVKLALTIGLAAVSYRFLEAPFLRLKDRFTFVRSSAPM